MAKNRVPVSVEPAQAKFSEQQRAILVTLMLIGAAVRIVYHDVPQYSRADELVYLQYGCRLASAGLGEYPALSRDFLANPTAWLSPPPFRWGFILPSALAVAISQCNMSVLGWLSTLTGILAMFATFLVARRLVGINAALIATALSVTSTLQIAMGRRALSDEAFCAAALVTLWLLLRLVQAPKRTPSLYALVVAGLTLCIAIKETFFLVVPAFALVIVLESGLRRIRVADVAMFVLPPILFYLVFAALDHSWSEFFTVFSSAQSTVGQEYAVRYQAGAWHRPLVDLFTLSPIVMMLAFAALGYVATTKAPRVRQLAALFGLISLAFCFAPSKNVRYIILADPLARALGGWALSERLLAFGKAGLAAVVGALALNAASELDIFNSIFIAARVYDPVADNLFRALHIIP